MIKGSLRILNLIAYYLYFLPLPNHYHCVLGPSSKTKYFYSGVSGREEPMDIVECDSDGEPASKSLTENQRFGLLAPVAQRFVEAMVKCGTNKVHQYRDEIEILIQRAKSGESLLGERVSNAEKSEQPVREASKVGFVWFCIMIKFPVKLSFCFSFMSASLSLWSSNFKHEYPRSQKVDLFHTWSEFSRQSLLGLRNMFMEYFLGLGKLSLKKKKVWNFPNSADPPPEFENTILFLFCVSWIGYKIPSNGQKLLP